jgi:hypothetical protein
MKRKTIPFIASSLVVAFFAMAQTFSASDYQQLQPLKGQWKMTTSWGEFWEDWQWRNNMLYGISYRVKGKDTTQLEQVNLPFENGRISFKVLTAFEEEKTRISFGLVSMQNRRFVFENLDHDFPQRIIYDLSKPDSLYARIEGIVDGKLQSSDYRYARVK